MFFILLPASICRDVRGRESARFRHACPDLVRCRRRRRGYRARGSLTSGQTSVCRDRRPYPDNSQSSVEDEHNVLIILPELLTRVDAVTWYL